jgi:meso-butanediol dehydrogenase/(S,S)-butanediol dehydrogenase/diacetyl reductase
VERFARDGWRVAFLDASREDGRRTASRAGRPGRRVVFVEGDAAREADARRLVAAAVDSWGRLDALVANAGARVYGRLLDATEADWERIVAVNLKGVAYACRAALPPMLRRGRGAIVAISSANALVGRAGMPLYDATKAAVCSLIRSLAVEHGKDGIRANAVLPGFTLTDFHVRAAARAGRSASSVRRAARGYGLLGRPAEPAEIAGAVRFLAGDDAAMVTGQSLLVDAGMSVPSAAAS